MPFKVLFEVVNQLGYIDLTLPTPADNLALDEALLEWLESGQQSEGLLRFWEADRPFVVLGYANRLEREVKVAACRELGIQVFRRCSGGGAVLQAGGCLNYALILKIEGPLEGVTEANCWIMRRNAAALEAVVGRPVEVCGYTDLAIGHLKISGNAQRRRRQWLLFHGTFLLEPDLELMAKVLPMPSKQPSYRESRDHHEFVTALQATSHLVKQALRTAWNATDALDPSKLPLASADKLSREKYSTAAWNLKW